MQVKIFGLACLMLLSTVVFGQKSMTDKTHDLDEVVVKSTKLQDYAVGSNVQKIDSLDKKMYVTASMAELLANLSLVRINENGPGGVSNPSIRGGVSAQTAVLWNGINLQDASNGSVDMAQLPAVFFDDVNVQYGGLGTLFGSGASAGAIHLASNDLFKTGNYLKLQLSGASFNSGKAFVANKIGNNKLSNSFKFFYLNADNDFSYDLADGTEKYQSNAGQKTISFLNEIQYKTSENSSLKASIWYQTYDKNIQTTISAVAPSQASQFDKQLYTSLNWGICTDRFSLKLNSALISKSMNYEDPVLDSKNMNVNRSLVNEVSAKYFIAKGQSITSGVNFTYEEGESRNFAGLESRRRLSGFVSYKAADIVDVITIVPSVRVEMLDGDFVPFIPSLGVSVKVAPKVILNSTISRVYRNPTFNDLYWYDPVWNMMGNEDLEAETGWSFDAGFEEEFKIGSVDMVLKQNFFLNKIDDWIVWTPSADYSSWSVENKDEGETIGIDLFAGSHFELGDVLFDVSASYTWIESNYVEVNGDEETESRMQYVPKHRFMINIGVGQKDWRVAYNHNYYDSRYTGAAYSGNLGAYFLSDLSAQYTINFDKDSLTMTARAKNLWDRNYQVIYDYAMPKINFEFSLLYNLNL